MLFLTLSAHVLDACSGIPLEVFIVEFYRVMAAGSQV